MNTYVYVDGFNLYNGALKRTPYKWLNLATMCKLLLPRCHIAQIRYFTAHVSARPTHPQAPVHQQVYLRALGTTPNVSVHLGQFTTHRKRAVLASSPPHLPEFVEIWRTDEKGSDVNLASFLLLDAFQDNYECGVIVSNDSDLATPARMARESLGKRIGIINPHPHPSKTLRSCADFFKQIREGVLRESQFPPLLSDKHGHFSRPVPWSKGE